MSEHLEFSDSFKLDDQQVLGMTNSFDFKRSNPSMKKKTEYLESLATDDYINEFQKAEMSVT